MSANAFGPWALSASECYRLSEYQRLRDLATRDAEKHDKLYQRDKSDALTAQNQGGRALCPPQLYVNLPSLVARSAADLVLSQPPVIHGQNDDVTSRIAALRERSKLDAYMWRAIYWTSILGDTYFTIADKQAGGKTLPIIKFRRAINSVSRNIRPEDSDSTRALLCLSMLGEVQLYTHYVAGRIEFSAFKKNEKGEYEKTELPSGYVEAIDTRETFPLFVHLGALRGDDTDENFGESDIKDTPDLTFEIANRLRQVAKILDRHAEPAANVPEGTLDENGELAVRRAKVFERGIDGKGIEYATWQSQLAEAYTEIDRLLRLIALITETPLALWGLDEGGQAESGRALKFRLLIGLGKARRTGMMLRHGVAEAVRLALRREDILANKTPGDYTITVDLAETFIADELETADHVAKLRQSNAMSTHEAVAVGQGLSGEELEDEVRRIQSEGDPGLGFEAARRLGDLAVAGNPTDAEPQIAPAPGKGDEAPVDKVTPVEPLAINGEVVQGLIALVKVKLMKVEEVRDRLGLAKVTAEEIAAIERAIAEQSAAPTAEAV